MANSTALVLTAGAIALSDELLIKHNSGTALRIAAATGIATIINAGLDKAIPGLGIGIGAVLVVAAALHSAPRLLDFFNGKAVK